MCCARWSGAPLTAAPPAFLSHLGGKDTTIRKSTHFHSENYEDVGWECRLQDRGQGREGSCTPEDTQEGGAQPQGTSPRAAPMAPQPQVRELSAQRLQQVTSRA